MRLGAVEHDSVLDPLESRDIADDPEVVLGHRISEELASPEIEAGHVARDRPHTAVTTAYTAVRMRLEWLEWADLEIDNVRAVLQRCLAHADAPRGIDLATSLGWYWITRATTYCKARGGWTSSSHLETAIRRRVPGLTSSADSWPCCRPILEPPGQRCKQQWQRPGRPNSGICCQKRYPWRRSRRTWPVIAHQPGACSTRLKPRQPALVTSTARSRSSRPGHSAVSSRLISTQSDRRRRGNASRRRATDLYVLGDEHDRLRGAGDDRATPSGACRAGRLPGACPARWRDRGVAHGQG